MATQDNSDARQENDDITGQAQIPAERRSGGETNSNAVKTENTPTTQDAMFADAETVEATQPVPNATLVGATRVRRIKQVTGAAGLHKTDLTHATPDTAVSVTANVSSAPQSTHKQQRVLPRLRLRWAAFRLWRLRRPFWGSILMLLASLLMLYGPVALLGSGFVFLPGSPVPLALLVGSLMLVMALAQLFVPTHAVITGLIGIVLSLASLITGSFGGLGVGMLLGIFGSAQGVAWKGNARALPTKRSSGRNRVAVRRNPQPKKGGRYQ